MKDEQPLKDLNSVLQGLEESKTDKIMNPEDPKYYGPPKVIYLIPFAMASAGKSYTWQKI